MVRYKRHASSAKCPVCANMRQIRRKGNRKPAYKKPLAERKKIPRHD